MSFHKAPLWMIHHWRIDGFGIFTLTQWVSRPPGRCLSGYCFKRWILLLTSCTQSLQGGDTSQSDPTEHGTHIFGFLIYGAGVKDNTNGCFSYLQTSLWQLTGGLFKSYSAQIILFIRSCECRICIWPPLLETVFVCVCPTSRDLIGILRRYNWISQPLGLSLVSSVSLTSFSCCRWNRLIMLADFHRIRNCFLESPFSVWVYMCHKESTNIET